MPVEDHPVHPKTIRAADAKPACYNRTGYANGYYAPDRMYRPDGTFVINQIYIKTSWIDYERCPNKDYEECIGCTW